MHSTAPTTLRAAVLPHPTQLTDALLVSAGALVVALAAQVSFYLPSTPVPITGQTFGVLLVGSALGTVRGASSMVLYVLLGAVGLPVYTDGAHGWTATTGVTGGYLLGFVLAGALVGRLAERRWDTSFASALSAMLTGSVVIYACGLAWLALDLGTGFERTLQLGLYPFLVGDLLKLYLAAVLLPASWRLVDRVR